MMENEKDVSTCRTSIREELSKMSFEELQKLKEKLGSKVYNEAMFGSGKERTTNFKRDNKNRPREMSSKRPIPTQTMVIPTKQSASRDPRFDSLCGEFNEKDFSRSYSFLNRIRAKEKVQLKKELQVEDDPDRRSNIKYLIQRMENQERERQNKRKKMKKQSKEHSAHIESLEQGEKPRYLKKGEKKVLNLVEQYEDLKRTGKLSKHIEKQRKKNARRDKKKLIITET